MRRNLFLLSALCVASLSAATVQPTLTGILSSVTVDRIIDPSSTGTNGLQNELVGLITFSLPGGGSLYAYCVEPQQSTTAINASAVYTVDPTLLLAPTNVGGMSPATAAALRLLLGQLPTAFDPSLSQLEQAAMQIAIWEIVRETSGSYNLGSGVVQFSNASLAGVLTQAQTWLDSVTAGSGVANTNAVALVHNDFQDLLTPDTGFDSPEPGTLGLLALAIGPLAFLARRRKQ